MPSEGRRLSLVVRADATPAVGAGHFMRCLALAEGCVARGGDATFVTRCGSEALLARAKAAGVIVDLLPLEGSVEEEMEALRAAVSRPPERRRARWVVLDGYGYGPEYQRAVREMGARTLVLDDTAHQPAYETDVLLNQNLDATHREYPVQPGTVLLLGTRFALLRREFLPWGVAERPVRRTAERILVTLGGADPGNQTPGVLEGIARAGISMEEVRVMVGPANPHRAPLEAWIASSDLPVTLLDGGPRMPEQMAWADLAVSASGSTSWELSFMGVPSILVTAAENQAAIARGLDALGAARSIGAVADPDAIAAAVKELAADREARRTMGARGRELVDGRGVERVLNVLGTLSAGASGNRIILRRAAPADALDLLRIANDPGVRANAFNPHPIPLESHLRWYARKLESADTAIWVIELAGVVAAHVRYDRMEDGETAEIGYAVSSAFRGMGLGTRILELTWRMACQVLGVSAVRGVVIQGNTASVRAFEKAGFRGAGETEMHGRACLAFERRLAAAVGAA
ncbi:MAG TPA: UDP-2,4-diacetamido-2,4,6-trideoxy-beta-L-altropyranose hydrolase [Longimicrobium sp.]|nr:UDP-2,4-diacetamido-2,4,6-trideoxy-beta-L-altropyranose hydrolase [Longimicrobium sp.]